ncbi:MAG: acylneuraminate cytidylyltransferase family protein [Candidatus Margulisbacteria bacterium]|jgi:N-acylneuraminate cytidylyltransferase|nr:acylneuraminate cytidylyltransferase family protein [Candidatus Margulisiibacteriota bacterium]
MKKKVLCVIPARGGSKRLPNKNILPLGGKPLIAHTIDQAKQSKLLTMIIVSTDDPQIAKIAEQYGAEVVWRPKSISGDHATSESALQHVLGQVEKGGFCPDLVVLLQCTSPIRRADDIDRAIKTLYKKKADSLLSVCRNDRFFWRRAINGVEPINYDYRRRMRDQDHPEEYQENGSIYMCITEILKKTNVRLGGKVEVHVMDYWSSFQIDSPEDFELCEWIINKEEA